MEKNCNSVTYIIKNYERGLLNGFYHAEHLSSDHPYNPKYICINCAKLVKALNETGYKRPKVTKRCLAKFMPSPSDCESCVCDHIEVTYNDLKRNWLKASYQDQCQFMAFLGSEVAAGIKEDFDNNILKLKHHGSYGSQALKDLELCSYLKKREQRLVCILLGIAGKSISGLGSNIAMVVAIVESVYNLKLNSIMPFRYLNFNTQTLASAIG